MNLDEIKEAVNYYRGVGGVVSRTNVYEHCLLNLASLILESASVMPKEPKCGKSYPSCVVCPYHEDCETYEKILIIEHCTLIHAKAMLEKEQEISQLKETVEHEKRRADDLHGRRIDELEKENSALKEKVAGAREALAHIRDILGQPPDRISDITIGAYADIRQRVLDVTTKFLEGV